MKTVAINDIITYDEQTGLNISSRGEILEDLKNLTKIAYGTDYVIEQGNEWFSFLDLLAGTLSNLGGACQKLYSSLSFTGASGTNLDNVVSYVGITRRPETNSRVLIKATVDASADPPVNRPINFQTGEIVLIDSNGNSWANINELYITEYKTDGQTQNYIGTATFEATSQNNNPTNIILNPYNNGEGNLIVSQNSNIPSGISFTNEVGSKLGHPLENDAQLRNRYRNEVFKDAVGSIEGLIAQVIDNSNSTYCYVVENSQSSAVNGLPAHSIWVITDGKSTWKPEYIQFIPTPSAIDGYIGHYVEYDSIKTPVTEDNKNNLDITPGTTEAYDISTSTDPDDINIAQAILNYKSLGCGIGTESSAPNYNSSTGEGKIPVRIAINNNEYNVIFSRASKVDIKLKLTIATTMVEGSQRDSVELQIKRNIMDYINNLGISNDVLSSGVYASVYNVILDNKYSDYLLDINSIEFNDDPNKKRVNIQQYEYANITENKITITWTNTN